MKQHNKPTHGNNSIINKLDQIKNYFSTCIYTPRKVGRPSKLSYAEIACLCWLKSRYQIKSLHALYLEVKDNFSLYFNLPSYCNFVAAINKGTCFLLYLLRLVMACNTAPQIVIDSTPIPVCHIKRERRHKIMKSLASKSYHPLHGWFYGIKLHLLTDLHGRLVNFQFTTGTVFDGTILPNFIRKYQSKTYIADSAYLSKDYQDLASKYNSIILAKTRKNMKILATQEQTQLLNKRKKVESVISSIKDKYLLNTSLPRSVNGYLAHYIRCLFQYTFSYL
jgi:hypothetical protein